MKSKKKLLLLGVGAMSALALGVGATSTFAWFTASTAGASVASARNVTTVSPSEVHQTVGAVIPGLKVQLAVDDSKNLELAQYSTSGLKDSYNLTTGYIDADQHFTETAVFDGTNDALSAVVTIKLSFDTSIFDGSNKYTDDNGMVWTKSDVLTAMQARQVKVQVKPVDTTFTVATGTADNSKTYYKKTANGNKYYLPQTQPENGSALPADTYYTLVENNSLARVFVATSKASTNDVAEVETGNISLATLNGDGTTTIDDATIRVFVYGGITTSGSARKDDNAAAVAGQSLRATIVDTGTHA